MSLIRKFIYCFYLLLRNVYFLFTSYKQFICAWLNLPIRSKRGNAWLFQFEYSLLQDGKEETFLCTLQNKPGLGKPNASVILTVKCTWPKDKTTLIKRDGNLFLQQECIPVGCVLSVTVAVCFTGGLHIHPPEQAPPWSWHRPGRRLPRAGTPGSSPPRTDPLPVKRMTDMCKNITFATSLRAVNMKNIMSSKR